MTKRMKFLIAYDGSIYADAAVEDLLRAGLPREAEALVISVADVWLPVSDEPVDPSIPERISAAVKRARAHCSVEVVRPGVRSQVQGETEGCP